MVKLDEDVKVHGRSRGRVVGVTTCTSVKIHRMFSVI